MFHVEKEREGDGNKTVVEYGTLQNKQSKSPHIHAESVGPLQRPPSAELCTSGFYELCRCLILIPLHSS
jgi:hypothetical protein